MCHFLLILACLTSFADECILVANFVEQIDEEYLTFESSETKDSGAPLPVTTYNSFAGASYAFTHPPNSYDAQGHTMV